ncbi:MAG: thioredoxin family protein [Bacteroidota bacterium]
MKHFIWSFFIFSLLACNSSTTKNFSENGKLAVESKDSYAEIPWVEISEVENLVKAKSKKILVDVYTPWCGPCKMMDRMTFTNQEIIDQIGKNFYAVKFNAEGQDTVVFQGKTYANPNFKTEIPPNRRNTRHELSPFFAVRGYPSLVIMDEKMNIIGKIVGFKQPNQLKAELAKYM